MRGASSLYLFNLSFHIISWYLAEGIRKLFLNPSFHLNSSLHLIFFYLTYFVFQHIVNSIARFNRCTESNILPLEYFPWKKRKEMKKKKHWLIVWKELEAGSTLHAVFPPQIAVWKISFVKLNFSEKDFKEKYCKIQIKSEQTLTFYSMN